MTTTLHVGNLSFKLREEDLKDYFSKYGNVVDTYIVRRFNRPKGYGFIEFSSSQEAENAKNSANGESIEGREINIEFAKGKIEKSQREFVPRKRFGGGNRYRSSGYRSRSRSRSPRRRSDSRSRSRSPVRRRVGGNAYNSRPRNNNNRRNDSRSRSRSPVRRRAPRNYDRRSRSRSTGSGRPGRRYYTLNTRRPNVKRRNDRPQKPKAEKEPSSTVVYISNLPFSVDEEELLSLFNQFTVKTAHVVKSYNGRSRGYGFVEFESSADQEKAINAIHEKEVKGADGKERKVNVKVALVDKPSADTTTTETKKE